MDEAEMIDEQGTLGAFACPGGPKRTMLRVGGEDNVRNQSGYGDNALAPALFKTRSSRSLRNS